MNTVSNAADIRQKIEARRYNFFTFPVLEITIQYRKPDILKLAMNNTLPTLLADQVIKAYKANVEGRGDEYMKETSKLQIEADDKFLQELRDKGYNLLAELCTSHRIMDVPTSDFDNDIISWKDVPEADAMAFLMSLMSETQVSTTANGGETSVEEVSNFPVRKRSTKRNTSG